MPGLTLTQGNNEAGVDSLEIISADKGMVDSKMNMKQRCTLMAVKDNSILDSKSVPRKYERLFLPFIFFPCEASSKVASSLGFSQ